MDPVGEVAAPGSDPHPRLPSAQSSPYNDVTRRRSDVEAEMLLLLLLLLLLLQ